MENKLLNSGSDDEDSDTADIATRTRATYFAKKETRPPRPIEPNVQVQNHQEHAGRSGEVSEDKDLGNGGIWSANKVKLHTKFFDRIWWVTLVSSTWMTRKVFLDRA